MLCRQAGKRSSFPDERRDKEMSNRKPHSDNAGYIAERQYHGAHIVIYRAEEAGVDVGAKYAVVCEKHNCLVGTTSIPKAREILKSPDFCEECMTEAPVTQPVKVITTKDCPRCGGSGSHSFNLRDGTRCYGCGGTGKVAMAPEGQK